VTVSISIIQMLGASKALPETEHVGYICITLSLERDNRSKLMPLHTARVTHAIANGHSE